MKGFQTGWFWGLFALWGLVLSQVQAAPLQIQTWYTPKGSKVLFVHAPDIPMVDVQISFDAGSARDGEHWGLANLSAGLLSAGTQQHSEDEISEIFNRYGAIFAQEVDRDRALFSLRTLTRKANYQATTQLFAEVLGLPTFPKRVFEREQANFIEALKQKKVKPSIIASEAFWQALYGEHPYAHPVSGTQASLKLLKPEQLQAFHQKYYTAKNATLAIVGAINLEQAKQLAQTLTQHLPKGHRLKPIPKVTMSAQAKSQVIDFKSSQTHYYLGQIAVQRGNPDYYALFLGNPLLGGSGFASLLMQSVREDRGLVYSVYSYLAPMKRPGPFVVSLSTQNAKAKEADQVVQETLHRFMQGDFSEQKLQAIKDNLIGGFPLRLDSNKKIVQYLSMMAFYDLPIDYLQTFVQNIAALTKADVLAAWQKHIHPNKMVKVMVGQPKLK